MPVEHPWFSEELPVFVAAGRLVVQRGFDTLLRAFAELARNHEAPLRPKLEKLDASINATILRG
jgi:hypothetical protein